MKTEKLIKGLTVTWVDKAGDQDGDVPVVYSHRNPVMRTQMQLLKTRNRPEYMRVLAIAASRKIRWAVSVRTTFNEGIASDVHKEHVTETEFEASLVLSGAGALLESIQIEDCKVPDEWGYVSKVIRCVCL